MKLRPFSTAATAVLFLITVSACNTVHIHADSERMTRTYTPENISEIDVSGGIDVVLVKADTEKVVLDYCGDLDSYLLCEQAANRMDIDIRFLCTRVKYHGDVKTTAYVYYKNLKNVSIFSDCTAHLNGMESDSLELNLGYNCRADGKAVNVGNLRIRAFDNSELTLSGQAGYVYAQAENYSHLHLKDYTCQSAFCLNSGCSNTEITVTDDFTGSATGSSEIKVYGNPQKRKAETDNDGSIIRFYE